MARLLLAPLALLIVLAATGCNAAEQSQTETLPAAKAGPETIAVAGRFAGDGSCEITVDQRAPAGEGVARIHLAEPPQEAPDAPRFGILSCEMREPLPTGSTPESLPGFESAYLAFTLGTPGGEAQAGEFRAVASQRFQVTDSTAAGVQAIFPAREIPSWDGYAGSLAIESPNVVALKASFDLLLTPKTDMEQATRLLAPADTIG